MNVKAAAGRQGDAVRPWTESEEVYLVNAAGLLSLEDLGVFVNKEIDISLCRFSTLRWQAPTHLPS